MSITITLTDKEAQALYDVLEHECEQLEELRLPDCEDDPELKAVFQPMYDIATRVMICLLPHTDTTTTEDTDGT
tara:strand:+ start:225 stop:446 length:222 start_codon:yes stop_codon:yes gene_type:complete